MGDKDMILSTGFSAVSCCFIVCNSFSFHLLCVRF